MPWAVRRRLLYLSGVFIFFAVLIGVPVAVLTHRPPTCFDGIQNQGETAPDKGGPCALLDERFLQPHAILWSRAFPVRDGTYNAVAYIDNPNNAAGVMQVSYKFGLYDENNVVVAERTGTTFIIPGAITPVFEGAIDTGHRSVAHTFFSFTSPLVWVRMRSMSSDIVVSNMAVTDTDTTPHVTADIANTDVADRIEPGFVAVVFDTSGNAFAASHTTLPRIAAGDKQTITFAWPDPFTEAVARVDIYPVYQPIVEGVTQ